MYILSFIRVFSVCSFMTCLIPESPCSRVFCPQIGAMANLEQWVSDRLHDILGLSDRYVSQFMIGIARKASSSEDFVTRLVQTGTIDIDQSIISFAQELYEKVYSSYSIAIPCEDVP